MLPEYIHSPRIGRSNLTNASAHLNQANLLSIDIKSYYPSTRADQIFRLFRRDFQCSDEVSGLLEKLCTCHRRLPFGSPLSPILCALLCLPMFDAIALVCAEHDLHLSIYVDNIDISGKRIAGHVEKDIKRIIHNFGYRYHKVRRHPIASRPIVTGVRLTYDGLAPGRKAHIKMRDSLGLLTSTGETAERLAIVNSLIGMNWSKAVIYDSGHPAQCRIKRQRQWLTGERKRLERLAAASSLDLQVMPLLRSADMDKPF